MKEILRGITGSNIEGLVIFIITGVLIYLTIKEDHEPMLLLPIGFRTILANIPFSSAGGEYGFLTVLYNSGIKNELFPILIFIAVGAMIDFTPLLQNPFMIFSGSIAQFGMFASMPDEIIFIFDLKEAGQMDSVVTQAVSANVSGKLRAVVAGGIPLAIVPL